GRIPRTAFFAIHRALRAGDFAAAQAALAEGAAPQTRRRPLPIRHRRRLVLHLGLHKTGTTYLQHHLLRHRAALAQAGVLVPRTGFDSPEAPLRPGATPGHQGLVRALRAGDDAPWQALHREIGRSGARTVVLSCENMGFPMRPDRDRLIAALADRLGGFDRIEPVVLARRPDAYVEALYRERIALGTRPGARGIGAFVVDHGAALTDWAGLFGAFEDRLGARVRFGDFDALRGDALWPGFAALAGLPGDLPALDVPRYAGPAREAVVILQVLNALVPDAALRERLLQGWFALNPAGGSDASLLPPAERAALLDLWQAQSQEFAAARGYAPAPEAARAALAAEDWQPPQTVPAEALLDLIDLAQQAADPLFAPPPAPARRAAKKSRGEMALVIRLRPWAADLVRKLRRNG
ncbi:MAG: hypothetical protein AB7S99_21510, partial [Pseudodonghicola sp.]